MPKNFCIMQIWAEPEKAALPICNYSQILLSSWCHPSLLRNCKLTKAAIPEPEITATNYATSCDTENKIFLSRYPCPCNVGKRLNYSPYAFTLHLTNPFHDKLSCRLTPAAGSLKGIICCTYLRSMILFLFNLLTV